MSLSTLQTTRSDKLAAARAAQATALSSRNARYGALTPSQGLDNVDMDYLLRDAQMGRFQKRIAKQVCSGCFLSHSYYILNKIC